MLPRIRIAAALCCLVSVALAERSGASVIDFESLTEGTLVEDSFPGVTFQNAIVRTAGVGLNEFESPPASGTNMAVDDGGPMSLIFAVPVTSFEVLINYGTSLTVSYFDASDVVFSTQTGAFQSNFAFSGDPGSSPLESFGEVGIISKVLISGSASGSSFAIDDVKIGPPIPEPSGALVFGLGLLIAARRGRR